MAKKILVNENEIRWMNKLAKEGKSIKEIAEETHRSKRSVERYTKETRDKMKSKQMELDLVEQDFFNIGEIDENGMIEVKVGRFVTYFAKEDIVTLVKRLVEKIDKLEGNE